MANRHLERIVWAPRREIDLGEWPYRIPAVRQLIDEGGFDVSPGVTVLIGENGSGKSTLVEAFAAAYPRAGAESTTGLVTGPTPSAEDSPLRWHLRARTHPMAAPGGFFLRAESMHEYLSQVDASDAERRGWGDQKLHARSHGESFLAVLQHLPDTLAGAGSCTVLARLPHRTGALSPAAARLIRRIAGMRSWY
jgi:predicted ATPase